MAKRAIFRQYFVADARRDGRLVGHKLARPPSHTLLRSGDTVDSWKVGIVEPEKQLTLLFGMKAPGLGGSFTLHDKGRYRELTCALVSTRNAGPDYLATDDPGAPVYFSGNGRRIARLAGPGNHRKMRKSCCILFVFPIAPADVVTEECATIY